MEAEASILACPLLRQEAEAVARPLGLRVRVGGLDCPCLHAGPTLGMASPPGSAELVPELGPAQAPLVALASLCSGLAQGGPTTCFHLLAPAALVDDLLGRGAHMVTPVWLQGWRAHLEGMGLDQPTARALYGEGSTEVVLLDTGVAPGADDDLADFARYVGLPGRALPVGTDHLRLRVEAQLSEARRRRAEAHAADEAALLDTIAQLAPDTEEAAVVGQFLDLLGLLVAPARSTYLSFGDGRLAEPVRRGQGSFAPLEAALRELAPGRDFAETPGGAGLVLRVGPEEAEVGRLGFEEVAFPEHLGRYRDLAPVLAHACWLSVTRARVMQELSRSEAELRRHRDELDRLVEERTAALVKTAGEREAAQAQARQLSGLLPICFGCKKIRDDAGYWTQLEVYIQQHSAATFSHGLCEQCMDKLYPGTD